MTHADRFTWRTFHTSKAGHSQQEFEDAFAGNLARGRFAIADGASESAFADAWAQILVNACVKDPGDWSQWLGKARKRWDAQVQGRELPWYAEAKFQEGAFAALMGLAIHQEHWQALAVGDCCLFQVRGDHLVRAFPMRHSKDFSNRPSLLGSRARQPDQPLTRRLRLRGDLLPGDDLWLMTDALAQWFLHQVEAGCTPWRNLLAIVTEEKFLRFMKELREAKLLRNDDVTLILIQRSNS